VRFQVFNDGKCADNFTVCGAHLFGTDGVGIRRAQVNFSDGYIECKKPNLETAGLVLLWPIDGFGKVLLPTTCLPERAEPYILNVEIARAKFMQIVNKREDWSYFEGTEHQSNISKDAQQLFIRAIQNIGNPPLASRLADEALKKAITFSEKLAAEQAASLFAARSGSHGFGRGCLGCKVDASLIGDAGYVERLVELFGSATVPINWAQVEPEKGQFDFSELDTCVEVLGKRKLAIAAGPLLFFAKRYIPNWLRGMDADFEIIREAAYQFISKVVSRYAGVVRAWYPVSGLNMYNHFGFRFEEILEMTRAANMAVKQGSDRALKIVEVANPWGEYYATTPNSVPPLVYMDMVVQSGVNFDAFGLQMRFGRNQSGMHVRDMMHVSAMLDCFVPIGKPFYITNVAVPSDERGGLQDGESAGVWHDRWDESLQGQWIEGFHKIALSKPFVDMVTYSHLADVDNSTIPNCGLLNERLVPKQSYGRLKKLRDVIFAR